MSLRSAGVGGASLVEEKGAIRMAVRFSVCPGPFFMASGALPGSDPGRDLNTRLGALMPEEQSALVGRSCTLRGLQRGLQVVREELESESERTQAAQLKSCLAATGGQRTSGSSPCMVRQEGRDTLLQGIWKSDARCRR